MGRGRALPPRRAILRHFGDRATPAADGPCCDVCDPSLVPRAAGRAARARPDRAARSSAQRRAAGDLGELDDAILDVVAARRARGRPHARRRDPPRRALEGDREVQLRRAAGLRHVRRTCAPTTVLARVDALLAAGHAALDRRALPEAARRRERLRIAVLASGAGTNLQALLDTRPRRARGSRSSRSARTSRTRRRSSARGRPASTTARLPAAELRRPRRARRARWPTGSPAHGVELVVLAGYMQLLVAGFLGRFPQRVDQRAPGAAAGVPGPRRGRAGARARGARSSASPCTSSTRASTPGRSSSSARSSCRTRRDAPRTRAALHPLEHELLPRGDPADRARRGADRPATRAACCWSRSYPRGRDAREAMTRRARCGSAARCCRSRTRPGIVDFARGLAELGVEIVSTGGTAGALATPGSTSLDRPTSPASRRSWTGASRRCTRSSTRACSPCATTPSTWRRRGARGRVRRPRVREPLPVRADRRAARRRPTPR